MGREIARLLSNEGYIVGLASHRLELLRSLQEELLPRQTYIKQLDVADVHARESLK
jgi:NADP-dependent 3-hydroxy acid dehydrogenase YdfG